METKIYSSIAELAERFDAFFFDASGVLWSGKSIYPGAAEALSSLVAAGKAVYVMSNTTIVSEEARAMCQKNGIEKGAYYHEFITSGDVARKMLSERRLSFENNPQPRKYYIFGTPNRKLFDGMPYEEVERPEKADFFYFSTPQLTEAEAAAAPSGTAFESKTPKDGAPRLWNSTTIEPFIHRLKEFLALDLPGFSANPDLKAPTIPRGWDGAPIFMVRQGALVKEYEMMGGEVIEIGKPHPEIYELAFDLLKKNGPNINPDRILMVGDTIRTDIKGANGAGIKSALCIETGITAGSVMRGGRLDIDRLAAMEEAEGAHPDFLIRSAGRA